MLIIDSVKIGERLKELAKKNNLTVENLAERLYVSNIAVYHWFNGSSLPRIERLYDLSKIFGVSIDYLVTGEDINVNEKK